MAGLSRVTSRKNPLLAELAALGKNPPPDRALAEGPHLCAEAFHKSQVAVHGLYLTDMAAATPEGQGLLAAAAARGVPATLMTEECYAKITQLNAPEGMACVVTPPAATLTGIFARPAPKVLVAAGVQDPGNAGALARVAEAAGADAVVYAGGANPRKSRFLRAAMGSAFRLPCVSAAPGEVLEAARGRGLALYAAAAAPGAVDFRAVAPPPAFALVMGAEGLGVPEEFLKAADKVLKLPMAGQVESLNVAVAAGILLYRLMGLTG